MWKHSLSFLIPTHMRHVRSCGQKCGLTFSCWWCFLERKTFPARFFCLQWRETWETSLHDAWTFRRVARTTSFRPWSCTCHARGWENMFHPFFIRRHRREHLAELKFGELLHWRLRKWQRCERAVCHTIQCFLSGENDDQQETPLLLPGTREASTCSATKRRATRIGTLSRRLVKMFHPQRSDKSPGSDGTNFDNLKKKLFLSSNVDIRDVLHSVRLNFLDGMSGCEFWKLIPKRSLKRSIKTESEQNSVDHFRKGHSLQVDRLRQLLFGSFLFLFRVCSATWLLKGSNCGST